MMDSIQNIQVCVQTDIEIKDILLNSAGVPDKCHRLVARALDMGGKDNVTVIVVQT